MDVDQCKMALNRGQMKTLRVILDRTFFQFKSADRGEKMIEVFGAEAIRTAAIHAKFAVIGNDDWKIALRTSANMNKNARMENFEISEDPGLYGFLLQAADDIFENHEIGSQHELPLLNTVDTVAPPVAVSRPDLKKLRTARPTR